MTSTTRRTVLSAGAVGLVLGPLLIAPEVFAAATTRKDLYARHRFVALRRRTFRLEGPTRTWRVRLLDVENLPRARRGDQRSFILTFRCRVAGPEQGSYVLRRPGFKPTTLFLVPRDERQRTYDAVVFRRH